MTPEDFAKVLDSRVLRMSKILGCKAEEYARGGDRLSNFKEASPFLHATPERVLLGFVAKHITALRDFIEDIDNDRFASLEQWDEKIGDIINYMVLLEALVIERADERQKNRKLSPAEALVEMREEAKNATR